MITAETLKRRIAAAAKQIKADLVIKNGKIIDVFNGDIISADVAITDGIIVGIGSYEGEKTFDARGRYISPGFIDGHVHIESAMITPNEFAKIVIPHGVTTVIADPHEIANVGGVSAIEFMLQASEDLPLNVYIALPSCVPATPFEQNGAVLEAESLEPLYAHKRVIGLGEVMDYPSVRDGNSSIVNKLVSATNLGKPIDGHAAGLDANSINVYATAGIRTDHECNTAEAALDRLRRGMYLMIREGSITKDLHELIKIVNERNARRCLFVTDDKDLEDFISEGSIDHNIRLAIKHGIDPITAYQIGTINAAECFGLKNKGAVAPGFDADLLLLNRMDTVDITHVFSRGQIVYDDGTLIPWEAPSATPPEHLMNSVQVNNITVEDLAIPMETGERAHVIGIIPNSLFTEHLIEDVPVVNGAFQPSIKNDQLKLAVIERHKKSGKIGLGIVKGFGLKSGSIASTFAHDSHNIIAIGTNDQDIITAVKEIQNIRGGFVIANDGEILASLPLPIAGLMSDKDYESVGIDLSKCQDALQRLGCSTDFNPFITLSFLALPVIPYLKMTVSGLFDVQTFQNIPILAK